MGTTEREVRISRRGVDAMKVSSVVAGRMFVGPEEPDEDGYFHISLGHDVLARLDELGCDVDDPVDLGEFVHDLVFPDEH